MENTNDADGNSVSPPCYPRFSAGRWNVAVEFGDHVFGIGWWKGSSKALAWSRGYYDGQWFGVRVGPLFYSRGPY